MFCLHGPFIKRIGTQCFAQDCWGWGHTIASSRRHQNCSFCEASRYITNCTIKIGACISLQVCVQSKAQQGTLLYADIIELMMSALCSSAQTEALEEPLGCLYSRIKLTNFHCLIGLWRRFSLKRMVATGVCYLKGPKTMSLLKCWHLIYACVGFLCKRFPPPLFFFPKYRGFVSLVDVLHFLWLA